MDQHAAHRRLAVLGDAVAANSAAGVRVKTGSRKGIRRAWPGYKLHERDRYLFIDEQAIESMEGCAQSVAEATKVTKGTDLLPTDKPWMKHWRLGAYINTIYDEEEQLFKIWYGVNEEADNLAYDKNALAYAYSTDGLHWETPVLNLVEDATGSKANNLVWPGFRGGAGTGVMKDPVELDPAKKYKMLFMFCTEEMQFAGLTQPVCLAYSPDGVHWEAVKGWVNPVIPSGTDTQLAFHWVRRARPCPCAEP